MRTKNYFLGILAFFGVINFCFSQVNLQTGAAEYSIPLLSYEDKGNRLNTFLSLDYVGGNGIKVTDIPSIVGSGWILGGIGSITRIQNGEADDQKQEGVFDPNPYIVSGPSVSHYQQNYYPDGYLYTSVNPATSVNNGAATLPLFSTSFEYKQLPLYIADRELDYFSFSFNGRQGIFVIGKDGSIRVLEDSKLKITKVITDMSSEDIVTRISEFHILDEFGIKFIFKDLELSEMMDFKSNNRLKDHIVPGNSSLDRTINVSRATETGRYVVQNWLLSEIQNSLSGEKIEYSYEEVMADLPGQKSAHASGTTMTIVVNRSKGVSKRLKKISSSGKLSVDFYYKSDNRQDIMYEKALERIQVSQFGNSILTWNFDYGYFVKDQLFPYSQELTSTQKKQARLALLNLTKGDKYNFEKEPPYQFEYYLGDYSYKYTVNDVEYNGFDHIEIYPINSFYYDQYGYPNKPGTLDPEVDGNSLHELEDGFFTWPFNISISQGVDVGDLEFYTYGAQNPTPGSKTPRGNDIYAGILKSVETPMSGKLTFVYDRRKGIEYGGGEEFGGGLNVIKTVNQSGFDEDIITSYKYVKENGATSGWGLEKHEYQKATEFTIENCSGSGQNNPPSVWTTISSNFQSIMQQTSKGFSMGMGFGPSLFHAISGALIASIIKEVITFIFTPAFKDETVLEWFSVSSQSANSLPFMFSRVEVSVIKDNEELGKTVHEFTSDNDYAIEVMDPVVRTSKRMRYTPWSYGLPKSVTVFGKNGLKKSRKEYFYNRTVSVLTDNNFLSQSWAAKRNFYVCSPSFYEPTTDEIDHDLYYPLTGRVDLVQTKDYVYNENEEFAVQQVDYTYSPHNFKLNKTTWVNAKGEEMETHVYYASDFTISGALETMRGDNVNMINLPVCIQTFITKSNGKFLVDGVSTEFSITSNGDIKPVKTYTLKSNSPVPEAQALFDPAELLPSEKYKLSQTIGYNNSLPVLLKTESIKTATLYDYGGAYAIASIVNAAPEEVTYTSFETDQTGGWSVVGDWINSSLYITGKQSLKSALTGSCIISKTTDPLRRYKLSFWHKGEMPSLLGSGYSLIRQYLNEANGFTYFEYVVQGQSSTGLSNLSGADPNYVYKEFWIDELRLYPVEAQMATITYEPGIGKTSECDVNGRIIYYEYDSFGRLVFERDDKGNITRRICYNYKGQPGNCDNYFFLSQSKQKTATKNNCEPGYSPSGQVTYHVPQGRYSSTISQADADAKAQADADANAQSYANTNGSCTFDGCNFVVAGTGTLGENSMTREGNEVSFYLHVHNLSNTNWSANAVLVATVNGYCKPLTTSFSTTFSENGRTWRVMITPSGDVLLLYLSGPTPTNGISVHVPHTSFIIE